MRLTTHSQNFALHLKSLITFDVNWKTVILAVPFLFAMTMMAPAQVTINENGVAQLAVDQGVAEGTPLTDQFEEGYAEADVGSPESFNVRYTGLDEEIASLVALLCRDMMSGEAVALEVCSLGEDANDLLEDMRTETLLSLLRARSELAVAEAQTAALEAQLEAERRRGELQEGLLENGIVYTIDEMDEVRAEATGYWEEILELREQLNLLQDEAAEGCRESAAAGALHEACVKPGHQAALERP